MPTEGELLERSRAGDQRAFGELVERHKSHIWGVCLRTTGNTHDAEDALQDTLLAAWRNIGKFEGNSRFGTWVYRIAARAGIDQIRKRRDIPTEELPGEELRGVEARRDFADSVVIGDAVQAALMELPEDFRTALVLREIGDLSYDEIAAHQGIAVATVKTRLHRARRMLRAELDE